MEKAMNNKGYMAARVDVDTVSKGKRMDVFYRVSANTPHYIDDIDYRISTIRFPGLSSGNMSLIRF